MSNDHGIYRSLQRHLNKQPIGFPAALLGSDIRFLRRIFTPEETKVALTLSYKLSSLDEIAPKVSPEFSTAQTTALLEKMLQKGTIGWKKKNNTDHWYLIPLVVGIYEHVQDGQADAEFLKDADAYIRTLPYSTAFVNVNPPQMRTIPINKSVSMLHPVSTYNQIRGLIEKAGGPFVVLPCICRSKAALKGNPCKKTIRKESCFAMNDSGNMILKRGNGREITREEALEFFKQSEADGLVLQPANTENPEFICSCCGCCCGMLAVQHFLPNPVEFWNSDYQAEVDQALCKHCGKCVTRCQVHAVAQSGPKEKARVNLKRCIGCGLCVPTCPAKAISLKKKEQTAPLPKDEEALYEEIMKNKKSVWAQMATMFKIGVKIGKPWARPKF